jgi:hypothetical protein
MDRTRVSVGVLTGAGLGFAVYALGRPVTVGADPVMAATFAAAGAFLAFLVAAGPWVREHTTIPYRDAAPPSGWRGRRVDS